MSSRVVGVTLDTNPEYIKHLKIYMVCEDAGVSLPKETENFFNSDLPERKLEVDVKSTEWSDGDMQEGIEILVSDIPAGVEKIRFINSW